MSELKTTQVDAKQFRERTAMISRVLLTDWVGEARAQEAIGRISVAISAAAQSAKNPQDYYDCTPASVAKVIAISSLTGIMPGSGQGALAYAIPRRPRKGDPLQLNYQLSHRGIAALARRAGSSLIAIPISIRDELTVDAFGEVHVASRDFDNPPSTWDDLRGVIVMVKSILNGTIISCQFVSKSVISIRRDSSDSYQFAEKTDWAKASDPWHKWPIEMSMKAAMHYAVNRGWCVIDDTEAVRALEVDGECDRPLLIDESAISASATLAKSLTEQVEAEPVAQQVFDSHGLPA
jgi:recombinational DNA repair protein RecT